MEHHEMAGRYYHLDRGHPSRSLSVVWAVVHSPKYLSNVAYMVAGTPSPSYRLQRN